MGYGDKELMQMKNKLLFILFLAAFYSQCSNSEQNEKTYDIVVYGGTSAGVIAAYGAKMLGKSVVLIETGTRVGGMTSGGLGQTDIGNKYAVTGLAREFYRQVGSNYNKLETWKFEPKIALEVFHNYIRKADIPVIYDHCLTGINKNGNKIINILIDSTDDDLRGHPMKINGKIFIDCSYEGDLMALSGVTYVIGRESNEVYGETINGVQLMEGHQFPDGIGPYQVRNDPESGLLWGISDGNLKPSGSGDRKVQAYNFRICLTDDPDNLIPISRPDNYDSNRYELLLRLFEAQPEKRSLNDYFIFSIMPNHKTDINNRGAFSTDMIGMNYEYPDGDWKIRKKIFQDHLDYTKGLLYFYGHDLRVPEQLQIEMLNWGYPKDEYTENGHWTPQLYIREARRMVGAYVMTEKHCRGDSVVPDPIALAAYTMDSHNCQRLVVDRMVKNEGNVEVGGFPPYPISYHCLLPREEECNNLIVPVCLSASHIAYGSIRMEPVFMVLGETASVAASYAIDKQSPIQSVSYQEINKKLKGDPLLDGTPPDIVIDNEDPGIEYAGPWKTESHFMQNYKNSLSIDKNPDQNDYFRFHFTTDASTDYTMYYYCPAYGPENENEKYPEEFFLRINSSDSTYETTLNFKNNIGNWAQIGTYQFIKDHPNSVEIRKSNPGNPLIADAVLLIPVKHK